MFRLTKGFLFVYSLADVIWDFTVGMIQKYREESRKKMDEGTARIVITVPTPLQSNCPMHLDKVFGKKKPVFKLSKTFKVSIGGNAGSLFRAYIFIRINQVAAGECNIHTRSAATEEMDAVDAAFSIAGNPQIVQDYVSRCLMSKSVNYDGILEATISKISYSNSMSVQTSWNNRNLSDIRISRYIENANTCALNVVLVMLSHEPVFRHSIDRALTKSVVIGNRLNSVVAEVWKAYEPIWRMCGGGNVHTESKYCQKMIKFYGLLTSFLGNGQMDAREIFRNILDSPLPKIPFFTHAQIPQKFFKVYY